MKSLAEWETILTNDLRAFKHLTGQDEVSRMRRAMKEQEIGQHCCQAGESLTDQELTLLKRTLGLTQHQWQAYQSKMGLTPE